MENHQGNFDQIYAQAGQNVNPIFPRMFASGTFVNSFSPKSDREKKCVISAIEAFKPNIIIVVDDKLQEITLKSWLSDDKQFEFMRNNNTQIIHLNKSQGVVNNQNDSFQLFQEYFRGKNFELIQKKDQLMAKIQDIKRDVDL